jgi:protein-S-isoprenylcysteine O-methyltransferase Ste14
MSLLSRNIFINAIYYGLTVIALPACVLYLENRAGMAWRMRPLPVLAIICAVAGLVLQAWCIVLFHRVGRGTASPVAPTTTLVMTGPYRAIRNPLNVGEVLLFVALALWFGSVALLVYALLAWLAFHLFIVRFEEPYLAGLHDGTYERYRARVNRWLPRLWL